MPGRVCDGEAYILEAGVGEYYDASRNLAEISATLSIVSRNLTDRRRKTTGDDEPRLPECQACAGRLRPGDYQKPAAATVSPEPLCSGQAGLSLDGLAQWDAAVSLDRPGLPDPDRGRSAFFNGGG